MQTYAEAESNANLFAFACFTRRGGSPFGLPDTTGETGMQAGGLHCRGVNRICAEGKTTQKPTAKPEACIAEA